MFFTDGKLRGLEKFMQLPKYPTKRGGGRYRSSYKYTKGDCNCVNCLHWKKKHGCSKKVCLYIQERIDCGACSFDEILHNYCYQTCYKFNAYFFKFSHNFNFLSYLCEKYDILLT